MNRSVTTELLETIALLQGIVDQASEIVFTLNEAGVITTLNPAFDRITGLRCADWIGRPLADLVVPEEQAEIAAAIAASNTTKEAIAVRRATVSRPDGSRVVIEASFVRHVVDGKRTGFLGFGRDVTEQVAAHARLRESEQALRESQERFRLLARATNDGTYDWDMERDVLWWGDAHCALFGYAREENASVDTWKQRVHPDDRDRIWNSFQVAVETGQEIWSEEYRYRRADGTYAIVLDRATIMRDAHMMPVRVLGALTDMTERKHLQEQLAQAKRVSSLGRVAASIAHEFNNVLMGIQPNLEVIRRRGPEDLRLPIEHILQSVRRGKRVTDEILRFTRPGVPGLQCIDVREFFDKWSAEVRPALGSEIDVRFEIEEPLHMNADPLQMAQVFTNLAMNGRDAMADKGGTLTITASLATSFGSFSFGVVKSADRYVHIRVRDTGCGMTKEQLAHVFEPLFTTKKNGTGLGLAVSYQLVLQHEGYMFVESEPVAGTTFHIFVLAASPMLRVVQEPEERRLRTQRVLIVEDEIAVAMGIKALLELEDVDVDIVHTGAEALPAIERFHPDCVILDIGLPDMNGADLYRDLSQRWPSLGVLFSSGHADAAKLEPLLRSPSTALLLKPYEFETLKGALSRLTAGARPEQQLVAELPY